VIARCPDACRHGRSHPRQAGVEVSKCRAPIGLRQGLVGAVDHSPRFAFLVWRPGAGRLVHDGVEFGESPGSRSICHGRADRPSSMRDRQGAHR